MEPANLTPRRKPDDDALDALLRRPLAPLTDDGFTRNVLAALPVRQPARQPKPTRAIFIAVGALAGLTIAALRIGSLAAVESEWAPLKSATLQAATALNEPAALIAIAVAVVSTVYALCFATPRRR